MSGREAINAIPSSIGMQNNPVVSASARPESAEITVTAHSAGLTVEDTFTVTVDYFLLLFFISDLVVVILFIFYPYNIISD